MSLYVSMSLCLFVSMYLCSMYLCIYVSMYPCIHVSTYLRIYVSMYLCIYVFIYISMYICIYVSMYVCMYIYTRMYMYVYIYKYMWKSPQTGPGHIIHGRDINPEASVSWAKQEGSGTKMDVEWYQDTTNQNGHVPMNSWMICSWYASIPTSQGISRTWFQPDGFLLIWESQEKIWKNQYLKMGCLMKWYWI